LREPILRLCCQHELATGRFAGDCGFGRRIVLRGQFRRRKFSFERDTHCGCSAHGQSGTKNSIVFHARKGERPEVVVKMK
jgi:hypothetical protein